jgi:hypothetical protein
MRRWKLIGGAEESRVSIVIEETNVAVLRLKKYMKNPFFPCSDEGPKL